MTTASEFLASFGHPARALLAPAEHPVPLVARSDAAGLAELAVSAASLAAADLAGAKTVRLDPERIAVAFASERHLRIDGRTPTAFAPLSGFFATRDGWVRTHGNYPHHASALRSGLSLPSSADADDVAHALGELTSQLAVAAVSAAGGICAEVRAERSDLDTVWRAGPLVRMTPLGPAPPRPLHPVAGAPLAGIRVLDLTRVLAGPIATRTLALLGADVLRIDPPHMPEIVAQHLDTGHGKRSALLDLADREDRRRFDRLADRADVIVLGYRPGALTRIGLTPRLLALRHPGIVVAQLSAWGTPDRRGFDSIVQSESGIARLEASDDGRPGALPAQMLDHSAGYLLAAAVMVLLRRRADDGGSWLAETSLRRIAAELLGRPRTIAPSALGPVDPGPHSQTFDVDGSQVTTSRPAISYDDGPGDFAAPRAWGRDQPEWRDA